MINEQARSLLKVAILQLHVVKEKTKNILNTVKKINEASEAGAKLIILPECFNSEYGTEHFRENSEPIPDGPTCQTLGRVSRERQVWLVGGTIPEIDAKDGKLYNTCPVFSPEGVMVSKYRKMHLFDINIPNKIKFKESETISPGNSFCALKINDKFKIGIGICYDLRFPEFSSVLSGELGCNMLIFPSAFNVVTGPMHWHLLQRGRAVDNQCFVLTSSPAHDRGASYQAYGHSMIVAPTGEIVAEAGEDEEIIYANLDLEAVLSVREAIPNSQQKRTKLYSLPSSLTQKEI